MKHFTLLFCLFVVVVPSNRPTTTITLHLPSLLILYIGTTTYLNTFYKPMKVFST